MGVTKIEPSSVVGTEVKNIKRLKGSKKDIDDKLEYFRLGELLQDILNGKYDKNTIEKDANYIKGLQIEYENTYGKPSENDGNGSVTTNTGDETAQDSNPPAPKKKETEGQPVSNPEEPTPPATNQPVQDKKPDEPLPVPQKPVPKPQPAVPKQQTVPTTVKNKNTGNNNADNSGVIINGDHNIVFGAGLVAGKVVPVNPDKKTPEQKAKETEENIVNASKSNYTAAFADGAQVAKDLIGATNTSEKQNAIRLIMKQTKETIMGFIAGFNANDTVFGIKYGVGGLIDQIDNEGDILGGITDANWTKAEKKEVFEKIISTVLEWAKDMRYENDSNYTSLQNILKQVQNDKEIDTERADELIKELISKGMARTGV